MGTGRSQASTGRSQRDKYADFAARMDQALTLSLVPNSNPTRSPNPRTNPEPEPSSDPDPDPNPDPNPNPILAMGQAVANSQRSRRNSPGR